MKVKQIPMKYGDRLDSNYMIIYFQKIVFSDLEQTKQADCYSFLRVREKLKQIFIPT